MAGKNVFKYRANKGSLIEDVNGVVGDNSSPEFVRTERGLALVNVTPFGSGGEYSLPSKNVTLIVSGKLINKSNSGPIVDTGTAPGNKCGIFVYWLPTYGFGFYFRDGYGLMKYVYPGTGSDYDVGHFYFLKLDLTPTTLTGTVYNSRGSVILSKETNISTLEVGHTPNKLQLNYKLEILNITQVSLYLNGTISDDDFREEMQYFLNSHPTAPPKKLTYPMPTDLSSEDGLVYAMASQITGGKVVDIGGNGNTGTAYGVQSVKDGLYFDEYNSAVLVNYSPNLSIWSFSIRFRIKEIEDKIIFSSYNSFNANIRYSRALWIRGSDGLLGYTDGSGVQYRSDYYVKTPGVYTVTFVSDGTKVYFYVNGEYVGYRDVTTSSSLSLYSLGSYTPLFRGVEIQDLRIYNRALTEQEIQDYHNQWAQRIYLTEDFSDYPVGAKPPRNWYPGTGSYSVQELTEDDAVLSHLTKGTKYLKCDTSGTITLSSKKAYGTWEFDWYKGDDVSVFYANFVSLDNIGGYGHNGYQIIFHSTEKIYLRRTHSTATSLFETRTSYFENQKWYRIKITRTTDGEFTVYIKGGAFGDKWTLVDTTGGSGTNPVTDNIYTDSEFFVLDLDAGDRIANIVIKEGIEV